MTTSIRAAVQVDPSGRVEVHDAELDDPGPGTVLVKLHSSGICASQLIHLESPGSARPMLLGHEGYGEVVAMGDDMTDPDLRVGSRVLVTWLRRPGPAVPAPAVARLGDGRTAVSPNVFTWATHTLVHERHVVALPEGAPTSPTIAIAACAVATGYGAATTYAPTDQEPFSGLVIGLGGVGLAALAGLRDAGAHPIVAVDRAEEKLVLARAMGATHAFTSGEQDIVELVRELTPGRGLTFDGRPAAGADLVLDCVGAPATLSLALDSSREGSFAERTGGTVLLLGVAQQALDIDPTSLITSQRTLIGVVGGNVRIDLLPALAAVRGSGQLLCDELVTDRFGLDEIDHAVGELRRGAIRGRGILLLS